MNSALSRLFAILLLFSGEAAAIYAEMIGAKNFSSKPFIQVFLKMMLLIVIAGGFLIFGYMLGYKNFKNIWVVSAISITSILIIEPVLAYVIFHQLPTKGALVGLIFGILGFIASLVL